MTDRKRSSQPRIVRTYEFPTKPEKQTLGQYLYNSQDGKILGRTATGWGQLMLFYAAFYTVLAALFAICMQGLLVTLNHEYPKWQLEQSIIGASPGLSFRPMPEDVEQVAAIQYVAANKSDVAIWTDLINGFLEPYVDRTNLPPGTEQVICDFNTPPPAGKVCAFDVSKLGACTAEQNFGYNRSAPCIFLKLNRIYDWVPEYYDVDELPEEMPNDLANHIKDLSEQDRKQVWVSCQELSSAANKTELLVEYSPSRGFPSYYYPYRNQQGYLSPLVAVQFVRPPTKAPITIECRAWAKNILYRGGTRDRRGSLQFTMRID
ncbi:sodium/potassium-transporting ATPase subunit beta-1-like [Anopheles albimanus]|uniref:Sodium/potassium-transporting ATPase subunit beta n=1 Tax=Anopheles albimanus TaxID=7167 RepID=A0A8W7JVK1_ANOAL|nr:sodium/potassium-transporting ATPase subunit beta-1-like [Anopheles albimanus]XP_035779417.1 sodium/potassium-transporting ATPase subunit beta-1-like [Anopheles albimanus]